MSAQSEKAALSGGKYIEERTDALAGRTFRLAMDNGTEYEVRFLTKEVLEWRSRDEELRWEEYDALKFDETTCLVTVLLSGREHPTCITLILDEENSLVTMCISRLGVYPLRPRLAEVRFVFGAIRLMNQPLPVKRHSFTRDLVGKQITWHYNDGFINTHIYYSERFIRTRALQKAVTGSVAEEQAAMGREMEEGLRPEPLLYEEPARYVKIKDNVYVMTCIEDNMNRVEPDRGGNNLFILMNIKEGRDAGRTFFLDKNGVPESGMFRVKGELTEEDIAEVRKPSPYRVERGGGLKIAVIGADTEMGRQIAKEALHRHNAITAVVKKNDWPDSHRYTMVESEDYSFNAEGFDAVIDAREASVKVLAGGKESIILPPAELDTVAYREGTYRVVEGAGKYLSAGDLAVAVVDDAENPRGITYGVELDKPEPEKEDPESMRRRMAMGQVGIAGKVYHLVMDNLGEFVAHFSTDSIVYFAKKGEPLRKYHCFCFKSDEQVWSAAFMIDKKSCTLVLDEAQRLVTMVTGMTEPAKPELVRHDFQFGALRVPGEDLPFVRHAFTDDLVGEKICWHYSKYVNITHCYTTENYMRSSLHNMKPVPEDAPDEVKRVIADRKYRWEYIFFEETAAFVRINPHLYVVTFIESQRNRMDTLQGGGDMVLTVNTRMMHDFGIGFSSGTGMPDFNLVSVHGDFDDVIVPFEVEKSPFHT